MGVCAPSINFYTRMRIHLLDPSCIVYEDHSRKYDSLCFWEPLVSTKMRILIKVNVQLFNISGGCLSYKVEVLDL